MTAGRLPLEDLNAQAALDEAWGFDENAPPLEPVEITIGAYTVRGRQLPPRPDPDHIRLEIGGFMPAWFHAAMADGRITVTNAKLGDLQWGRDGIDAQGHDGVFHVPLGGELREDQVKPPSS